jgi:hypothetical protein
MSPVRTKGKKITKTALIRDTDLSPETGSSLERKKSDSWQGSNILSGKDESGRI